MMGYSSERMLLDIAVGLPLVLCLVPLMLKVVDRIDARYDADLTGWRRTVVVVGLLVGMGLVITLLINALCSLLGWPVKGPWPGFMF